MILVDTSVWITHFRNSDATLQKLLETGEVLMHPFVIGELACGGLTNRKEIIALFRELPTLSVISQEEFLHFIDSYKLAGKGAGFVDIHLLASTIFHSDFLWTKDVSLYSLAQKFHVAFR